MIIDRFEYLLAGKTAYMLDKEDYDDVLCSISMSALTVLEAKGVQRISYGESGESYISMEELFRHYNLTSGE